jgi:hypothetical protein
VRVAAPRRLSTVANGLAALLIDPFGERDGEGGDGVAAGAGGPSATSNYYSADHLGSVRALHADNGTIVADLDTDTSGNREASVESVQQPFGWPLLTSMRGSTTASPGCITTAAATTTRTPAFGAPMVPIRRLEAASGGPERLETCRRKIIAADGGLAWTAGGQQSLAARRHVEADKEILCGFQGVVGAPGTIRTSDPQIRSLMLYPAELRVHWPGRR